MRTGSKRDLGQKRASAVERDGDGCLVTCCYCYNNSIDVSFIGSFVGPSLKNFDRMKFDNRSKRNTCLDRISDSDGHRHREIFLSSF